MTPLRLLPALAGLLALMAGCGHLGKKPDAAAGPGRSAGAATEAAPVPTPEGFFRVDILGVIPGPEGHALFLVEPLTHRILPIWIGQAEAMSIQLRLDRRRFERPLTHDLIDQLLEFFDARVIEVRVDAVHEGTFVATLTLSSAEGQTRLDVRPSDAIALAVGSRAPVFVAKEVMDRASLSADTLGAGRKGGLDPLIPGMPPPADPSSSEPAEPSEPPPPGSQEL